MLKELRIKNLAIIDDLTVRFEKGFNVLTGETGAGKSIIVDALSIALGNKAQSDLVRSGEKEADVQAYFEISEKSISEIGVSITDELILRRSVANTGKSRAYINDTMVSLQSLLNVGRSIIDIHGQHEHQSLLLIDKQRLLLDSYGRLQTEREKVETLFKEVQALNREMNDLKHKIKEKAQRHDLLKFQIQEINSASLKPGEKESLIEEKIVLLNLSRLKELTEQAYSILYGSENSCAEKLSSTMKKVKEMSLIDQSTSGILNLLESATPLLEDATISLRGLRDRYNIESDRLSEIEERLELIKKLEKKYGEGIEAILSYKDEAEKELKSLELTDERLNYLEAEIKMKEEILIKSANTLSEKRKIIANEIEGLIMKELSDLSFRNPEFRVDIKEVPMTSTGFDRVEFLFSANPGEPPKPLSKVASGGELSRVMLAVKSILADVDNIPVLVFDEVDAGIGGKTAERVGKKLKAISKRHQVLCTTHLAQIASLGDLHLKIEKINRDGRVFVEVKELSGDERVNEIARMLSGRITEVSLKHAKELLGSSV
ncbi:MAG: DNA repair protein RecN [Nitrospirae bacterium]|nr:DNA repair protein RecN [Nitrospirota bacterium]